VATGKERAPAEGHSGWVGMLTLLPDGKTLVTAGSDRTVRLWDVGTGRQVRRYEGRQSRGKAFAVSPDGRMVATGGDASDKTIRLMEARTGKPVREIKGHDGAVHTLAFRPDGKELLSAGKDKTVRVWDAAAGRELRRLAKHDEVVFWFAFSPDGKTLATCADTGAVRLWDYATGRELHSLQGQRYWAESAAFSPDGRRLASGAGSVTHLWDVGSGQLVRTFPQQGPIYYVTFSADGRTLAVASGDRLVRLWEVETGQERARLEGHRGAVAAVLFTPDGKTLISGSSDGTALVWDLAGSRWAALTAAQAEAAWRDLAGGDAAKAYRAIWALAASPERALPLLRKELRPVRGGDAKQVAKWLADLDADEFDAREKATEELAKLGPAAESALRKALDGAISAEVRKRVESLLAKLKPQAPNAEVTRRERMLELLERTEGAEAQKLLRELAAGAPEARLTQQAKAALGRRRP
jgi:dipeptidyl aminopeptidase/acylaminoacyl peptidase